MESDWRSRHDRLVAELRDLRSANNIVGSEMKRSVMSWGVGPSCLQRTFVDSRLDAGLEGLQSLRAHPQSRAEVEDLREQLRHALEAVEARNDDVWKLQLELQQQKKQIEDSSRELKAEISELQSGASRSSPRHDGQRSSPRVQGPLRRAAPPPQTSQSRQGPLRRAGCASSRSKLESPRMSRSRLESPTSGSRFESSTSSSRIESPTARSRMESTTSKSIIESPTSKSSIESPRYKPMCDSPTSRSNTDSPTGSHHSPTSGSKTESPTHELHQQTGTSLRAATAAAVAAAAFEGKPSLAGAHDKTESPVKHTFGGKAPHSFGSPPPRASQRLQSNLSSSASSRPGSQGRMASNKLRPTAPGAASPFRRSSSTQQLVGAPIDQPRKSVIARLATKGVAVVTSTSEAHAPALKVSSSLKSLHAPQAVPTR
eukprot:TRINITY_DN15971_c0_g1_i1.p1 TRINITY_DN15971_c0_g1~~TRINITY_DN15971_c0_g1_i1.p1  ORF type:complete len:449 (+),score=56.17 TRINITY_DN15971_c0_g1_i1:62-1348(+)